MGDDPRPEEEADGADARRELGRADTVALPGEDEGPPVEVRVPPKYRVERLLGRGGSGSSTSRGTSTSSGGSRSSS